MKSLDSLIRLRKLAVDERRRELRDLGRLEERLRAQSEALEAELTAEQGAAGDGSLETNLTYGDYAKVIIERRAHLQNSIADVQVRIEHARTELGTAFEELKRFEITKERKMEKAKREEMRREGQELDEIGLDQFRRKRNSS